MTRFLVRCIDAFAALGMLFLLVLVLTMVVSRSAFSASIPWGEEVGAYLMIWTGMLGTASHLQHDRFMALSLFHSSNKPGLQVALLTIAASATIAFLGVMFYTGLVMTAAPDARALSPAARIPMVLIYSIFPISAALIAIGYLRGVVAQMQGKDDQGMSSC